MSYLEDYEKERELSFINDANHSEEYLTFFKKMPQANVISKEAFEQRTAEVFHVLWETLSRSFGPYGANTTILNYPFSHVTKDGFTIMKNLSMNATETLVDQSIANLGSDICGRLNYAVGDGTTTAVIATNGIYQRYMRNRQKLNDLMVLPRDVSSYYKKLIVNLSEELTKKARTIQSNDDEVLYKNIYDVVYISSNGDTQISEYIANFYKQLHCPAITAETSPDGVTRAMLISGYQFNALLSDRLYINSDDDYMNLNEADIVIFTVKVNKTLYENIIKPMNEASRGRSRNLICLAPSYDSVLMDTMVRSALNDEYRKNKSINLVLMSYSAFGKSNRDIIEDFACLCNTVTLDQARCSDILKCIENGETFDNIFNMDNRIEIPKLTIRAVDPTRDGYAQMTAEEYLYYKSMGMSEFSNLVPLINGNDSNKYRVGYAKDISLGLKHSIFREFFYDENRYNAVLDAAKKELAELEEKYKALGTFNTDVSIAQNRYYSLGLKMGLIQVGGDGELSKKCLKDAVDDAVRAAASAYNHGVVLGCNTTLIEVLLKKWKSIDSTENSESSDLLLVDIILEGFLDVYRTLLGNAFENEDIIPENVVHMGFSDAFIEITDFISTKFKYNSPFNVNSEEFMDTLDLLNYKYGKITYHDLIIYYGILSHQGVFDISKKKYSKEVINSAQTDTEVLKATVDLITLLIVSNQMLVTQKRNFDITK